MRTLKIAGIVTFAWFAFGVYLLRSLVLWRPY